MDKNKKVIHRVQAICREKAYLLQLRKEKNCTPKCTLFFCLKVTFFELTGAYLEQGLSNDLNIPPIKYGTFME
jgi:hypothetical protein